MAPTVIAIDHSLPEVVSPIRENTYKPTRNDDESRKDDGSPRKPQESSSDESSSILEDRPRRRISRPQGPREGRQKEDPPMLNMREQSYRGQSVRIKRSDSDSTGSFNIQKHDKERSHRLRRQEKELRNLRSMYEDSKGTIERLQKERESSKKMMLEMSGIVKALQTVSVGYNKKTDAVASNGTAMENVRRKIQAIDDNMKRIKEERDSNKKMLLEMSGLVTALQGISVDYDKKEGPGTRGNTLENVQRKIKAIDKTLKEAMLHCGHLEQEKNLAKTALEAKDGHIKSLEGQISVLQTSMKAVVEEREIVPKSLEETKIAIERELRETIKARETQIHYMEQQILGLQNQVYHYESEKRDVVTQEIQVLQQNNAAKYAEIDSLETKLQALKMIQSEQTFQMKQLKERGSESVDLVVAECGDSSKYAEIDALQSRLQELAKIQSDQDKQLDGMQNGSALANKLNALQNAHQEHSRQVEELKERNEDHGGHLVLYEAPIQENGFDPYSDDSTEDNSTGISSSVYSDGQSKASSNHSRVLHRLPLDVIDEDAESQCNSIHGSSNEPSIAEKRSPSIQISPSEEEEGVEITMHECGSTDISELSYPNGNGNANIFTGSPKIDPAITRQNNSTWDTISLHSKSFEGSQGNRQLLEQLEEAKRKYDNLEAKYKIVLEEKAQDALQTKTEVIDEAPEGDASEKQDNEALTRRIAELEEENKKLRVNNENAISSMTEVYEVTSKAEALKKENESMKKTIEDQKDTLTLVNTRYEKMRQLHSATAQELVDEKAKYQQLLNDYEKISNSNEEADRYEKLEKLHHVVVLKMADLGEENETLHDQVDSLKQELMEAKLQTGEDQEMQHKHSEAITELKRVKESYFDLQRDHNSVTSRVGTLCDQYEDLKSKYNEAVQKSKESEEFDNKYYQLRLEYETTLERVHELEEAEEEKEKLKQECAEALAKVAVLEHTNDELEDIKDKHNTAAARVSILERELESATKKADAAKKKREDREAHLRDVIFHYKSLEKEYDEVTNKLQRLQAVMDKDAASVGDDNGSTVSSGAASVNLKVAEYQARIKWLQQQRDKAIEQMEAMEKDLIKAKQDMIHATKRKQAREKDLRVVLQNYQTLQTKYEEAIARVETLEAEAAKKMKRTSKVASTEIEDENVTEETTTAAESSDEESQADEQEMANEAIESNNVQEGIEKKSTNEGEVSQEPTMNDNAVASEDAMDASQAAESDVETTAQDGGIWDILSQEVNSIAKEEHATVLSSAEAEHQRQLQLAVVDEDAVNDDDSIARLLVDLDDLRRQKEERMKNMADDRDMSTVSNVSEVMTTSEVTTASEVLNNSGEFQSTDMFSCDTSTADSQQSGWKEHQIVQAMGELVDANDQIKDLSLQHEKAKAQLIIMERKLLIAKREAEDAKKRQASRETNLRDVITQHKKLERDHEEVKNKVAKLQEELAHAKKEARVREEEAKGARKRLVGCHYHFKKLQEEHELVLQRMQEQEEELEGFKFDASFMDDNENSRTFRNNLLAEKVKLIKENEEMKKMCDSLIAKMEKKGISVN